MYKYFCPSLYNRKPAVYSMDTFENPTFMLPNFFKVNLQPKCFKDVWKSDFITRRCGLTEESFINVKHKFKI